MAASCDSASTRNDKKRELSSEFAVEPLSSSDIHHASNGLHEDFGTKKARTASDNLVRTGEQLSMNPRYCSEHFKSAVRTLLKAFGEPHTDLSSKQDDFLNDVVFRRPFRHMIFSEFLHGPIDALETELLSQNFGTINKDLFKLSQTRELSTKDVPEFAEFTGLFRTEVRNWISEITGIGLSDEIDIRGAVYRYTDHLMCHDDKLDTRKIAYVYYLVDSDWTVEDGGTLDLFDSAFKNDSLVPGEIAKSIPPRRNQLVLFVVNDDSFHQVREVLNPRRTRLSITGWFHVPVAPPQLPVIIPHGKALPVEFLEATNVQQQICRLVKSDDPAVMRDKANWKKKFVRDKCIELLDLFDPGFCQKLTLELRSKDKVIPWVIPENRNQAGYYRYLDVNRPFGKDLINLDLMIKSMLTDQFLQSLTDITGIDMNPNISGPPGGIVINSVPSSINNRWFLNTIQFRLERFAHQNYTLRTFGDVQQGSVLDLFFYIDCDRLDSDTGGSLVVVDMDDEEDDWEVIAKFRGKNYGLLLIQRNDATVFYTEYVNHRWKSRGEGRPFYRLWLSVMAVTEEDQSSSNEETANPTGDVESEESSSNSSYEEEGEGVPPTVSGSSEEEDEPT